MEDGMQESTTLTVEQLSARLAAAVAMLERTIPRVTAMASDALGLTANPIAGALAGPIVATVEGSREAELAQKLAAAEKTIAELRASASHEGRKTLPVSLLAKQDGGMNDAGALDAALTGLSLEQRITVKAQLMRAGLV